MNNQNRIYYIIGGTLTAGLAIGLVLFIMAGGVSFPPPKGGKALNDSVVINNGSLEPHHLIEQKIDAISVNDVNPTQYSTLRTDITSAYNQKLFPESINQYLLNKLNETYKDAVITNLNREIRRNPVRESEMNILLSHLAIIGGAEREVADFKKVLAQLKYYTHTLPQKVNSFTGKSFTNYNSNTYLSLKNELETLPGIDARLKSNVAIKSAQSSSKEKLRKYYIAYVDYQMALDGF